jgi:hypothetical protein
MLDDFGFKDTENINTEWNINILYPQRDKDNAKNAAFTTCTLSLFQDSGIDQAYRYRGTGDSNRLTKFIGFDLALFTYDGQWKTPTLSYYIMDIIARLTPLRLQITSIDPSSGITCFGGISEDRKHISILLSNYEQHSFDYIVNITNIPNDLPYIASFYLVDNDHDFEIEKQIFIDSMTTELTGFLTTSSIHYIHLTNTGIYPNEGPDVYDIPYLMTLRFLDPIRTLFGLALLFFFFG